MSLVTADGETWLVDGEPITFRSLVERFSCNTPPDILVRLRTGEAPERFLLMASCEFEGDRRFHAVEDVPDGDIDALAKKIALAYERWHQRAKP